ncbi:MAG TPA: protein translocase subunit SecF [Vicinamibacterales bacterium]|nr:protein translocase subunit SecF [Vicinamibacterales bacterium]
MKIFDNANFNFLKWRWYAIAASLVVILAGAGLMVTKGLPLGIDFSGGAAFIIQGAGESDIRRALDVIPGDKVIQQYDDPSKGQILVRLPQAGDGSTLETQAEQIEQALAKAGLKTTIVNRELVSAVIGADLQKRGIYATLLSILAITIYIAIRFRPSFAIGAIAATFHDVFVTLAFLMFFGYDLSLNVVAALLTITGYSVNDTIVIFDRVRENLRSMRRQPLEEVVNLSVNQTLSRTIITAGTTFLSVLSLYLFGGEALRGFAFTMLVGIVSGTYSTIFIASAIAIILSQGRRRSGAAVEPAPNAQDKGRKPRRARAS